MATRLEKELMRFHSDVRELPGIADSRARATFIEQMIESLRRVAYPAKIAARDITPRRTDPNDDYFDPIKASILFKRTGEIEEAFWMVFLFVHFGKHASAGWRYARQLYGALGSPDRWSWERVSSNPEQFRDWFDSHLADFETDQPHGFGNHRKFEPLRRTGEVVESYVHWVAPPRTHQILMGEALHAATGDPRLAFDKLHQDMNVTHFGRTAKFDYLAMVGKLGLAPIEPGSAYMIGATGPLSGARLLFGSNSRPKDLDQAVSELESKLEVGMQTLEDALCNWQKSPTEFKSFRA